MRIRILEPQPQKAKAEPQRQKSAPDLRKQLAAKQSLSESRSRGAAYIPKPEFPEDKKQPVLRGNWKQWVIVSAAAAVLGLAALEIPQWLAPHHPSEFVLTAADVDQVATANARTVLRAGHTPPELARYPKELLQRIADGDESLYTKRLLPPEAAEMRVHVTVSQNGAVIRRRGIDTGASEHSILSGWKKFSHPVPFYCGAARAVPAGHLLGEIGEFRGGLHTTDGPGRK